jgi:hypothetical protein
VDCQHRLGGIPMNWHWSHYQFETELFCACRSSGRIDLILCGFLLRSKLPADSSVGPCPILPITHAQFSSSRQDKPGDQPPAQSNSQDKKNLAQEDPKKAADPKKKDDRMFYLMPNYLTVDGQAQVPLTNRVVWMLQRAS